MHEAVIPSPNNLVSNVTKSIDHTTKGLELPHFGAVLSDKTIREEILPMVDIMALQNHLERCIGAYGPMTPSLDGNVAHKESLDLAYAKTCLDVEFAELMQKLPWKKWKLEKYQKMTVADMVASLGKDGGEIAMEGADLVFFLNLMLIHLYRILGLPVTDDTTKVLYSVKWAENMERVRAGSFDGSVDRALERPPVRAMTAALAVATKVQEAKASE